MRGARLSTNASPKNNASRKAREADGHMECAESATSVPVPSGTGSNRHVLTVRWDGQKEVRSKRLNRLKSLCTKSAIASGRERVSICESVSKSIYVPIVR